MNDRKKIVEMNELANKRLLILGGKAIGSTEIVECAKKHGIYTIVADYLPYDRSPAKQIADEHMDISTSDIDALKKVVSEKKIDGVFCGVHEFNIQKMITLCEECNLPCYCSAEQWDLLQNKGNFKELCRKFDIPVTKEFTINDDIEFPVITKPADGSGSRGFSVCTSMSELENAYNNALEFSPRGQVLIEKYMDYKNSVIINYTIINGEIYFCGISDKKSKKISESKGPIMDIQYYPSTIKEKYVEKYDSKAKKMLSSLGFKTCVFWIEAFIDGDEMVFNEMGLRFGGSLTYFPVEYFYNINQLELLIEYSLLGCNKSEITYGEKKIDKTYCILPTHLEPGVIKRIEGIDELKKCLELVKVVTVHYLEDSIEDWGSAQQVYAYIHFATSADEIRNFEDYIAETLKVYDENGNNMLYILDKR